MAVNTVTIGLAEISLGDIGSDGGMSTSLTTWGLTEEDSCKFTIEQGDVKDFIPEELDDPIYTQITPGATTVTFTIMDPGTDTLEKVLGGTLVTTGTAPNQANIKGVVMPEQIAYMLATPYHETYDYLKGIRFGAMSELGGDTYLKAKPYYPFYGRGPSHLTWKYNYEKEAKRTGQDLVAHPELMLDVKIGCESHVYCMIHGSYTSKKLADYINVHTIDYIGARAIINGKDQAALIAGYAVDFLKCITD